MLMSVDHVTSAINPDSIHERYFKADQTGTRVFDYEKVEVLRLLLGNLAYWMEEFGFDGFRFNTVQGILYNHQGHGPPPDPENWEEYVTEEDSNNRRGVL